MTASNPVLAVIDRDIREAAEIVVPQSGGVTLHFEGAAAEGATITVYRVPDAAARDGGPLYAAAAYRTGCSGLSTGRESRSLARTPSAAAVNAFVRGFAARTEEAASR